MDKLRWQSTRGNNRRQARETAFSGVLTWVQIKLRKYKLIKFHILNISFIIFIPLSMLFDWSPRNHHYNVTTSRSIYLFAATPLKLSIFTGTTDSHIFLDNLILFSSTQTLFSNTTLGLRVIFTFSRTFHWKKSSRTQVALGNPWKYRFRCYVTMIITQVLQRTSVVSLWALIAECVAMTLTFAFIPLHTRASRIQVWVR